MSSKRSKRSSGAGLSGLIGLIAIAVLAYLVSQGILSPDILTGGTQQPIAIAPTQTVLPATSGPVPEGMPAWLKVYFTTANPDDTNTVDQYPLAAINAATQTIDMASFDINLPSIINALLEAKKRGVQVRVISDEENGNNDLEGSQSPDGQPYRPLALLKDAGISIVSGGRSNGLMHNKMIIVDSKVLFMGSWNMSYNDTYRNNNNLMEITNPTLIANYQAKFNEGFVDKRFGARAEVGAQTPSLVAGGVQVENYFSTVDEVMAKLVKYAQGAQKSIHFIAFTYTHDDLANAMIERAGAGVDVQGVIENRGASQGALVPLFCAKLPVLTDGNKYTMHHKVIIIDGQFVITGSYNFTKSADDSNDDNVIVIHSPAVAALYEQEFQRVYGIGQPPDPAEIKCP